MTCGEQGHILSSCMSAFNQVKMFVVLFVQSFVLLANRSPAFFEGCVDNMRDRKSKARF